LYASALRAFGIAFSAPQPGEIDDADDEPGYEGRADEGMGDAAMVGEAGNRAAEIRDHVEVGGLGGKHASDGRVPRALVQPAGAANGSACQEMGDGFQANKITFLIFDFRFLMC